LIKTLKASFFRHGYLLILSAWFYTLSFIFTNYWSYTSSPARVQQRFESFIKNSEDKFEEVSKDTAALTVILGGSRKAPTYLLENNNIESFYLYTKNDVGNYLLTFWSSHVVVPHHEDLQRKDGRYFVKYSNGEFEFLKRTMLLNGKDVLLACMIPVRWNYFWNNKYLKTEFAAFDELEERYDLDTTNTGFGIRSGDGKILFRLKEKEKGKMMYANYEALPLTLRVMVILLILVFINFLSYDVVKNHDWLKGFLFLVSTIVILRSLTYFFPFPFDFKQLELFDPSVYASNTLHPSLGDLLINILLLFWIISFLKYISVKPLKHLRQFDGRYVLMITLLLSIAFLAVSLTSAQIIRSLIVDSKISFDVANFFSLTIYTILSFIILCFIVLSFFHLTHILLILINKFSIEPWWKYIFVAGFGLMYLSFDLSSPSLASNLIVLAWLLVYMLILDNRPQDLYIPLMRSSFFLIWLIFFAASISALIIFENRYVEIEQRKRIAEKLAMQTDPSGESLMSLAITNFNNEFLANNFYRMRSENSNKIIKDSLINENFSGYLNKYDTRIYTFDADHNPLFNEDSASYEVIRNIIDNQSKLTNIPNLFYYENSVERFSYLFQKEIKVQGLTVGHFFVVAKPKRYKSEALYPELFKQVRDISSDLNVNYDYAVYSNGDILVNYGNHNFPTKLARQYYPKLEYEVRRHGDDTELWYNAGSNKIVVLAREGTLLYEAITLFAYLFGSFLFIVILFHAGSILFRSRFQWSGIKSSFNVSIRSQIQSTIIFISVFSFVVIAVATISFYIDRFNKTNTERLVRAISVMATEIQRQVATQAMFDDVVKIYDLGANSELESSISEVAEIHNVDVNFYDVNGVLKVSTQPYIYNKRILSEMMEPNAYYHLNFNNEMQYIQNETVGKFQYVSIYMPIRDDNGEAYAYLNIPYLNSERELNQEISNFLVTLINLNAFIFVLAGVIALFLTNRITRSFSLIGDKMKAINLGKYNEEIEWSQKDEIGSLVNEYNKMVKKLEESALVLAKSEREGAWREMARQVAHEIKNPLTPMKLSIQYLQRAIDDNRPNVKELAEKVSGTLIEQIDQLAKIASDFSQFANIGNTNLEVFDVHTVLTSLLALHSTNETIGIIYKPVEDAVYINADRHQVNRLFTNLIQNAIDASFEKDYATITITEEMRGGEILVAIKDEGVGIAPDKLNKIFVPNFTTKSSGTGLGLAICKGIVEKANGKIWFTTAEGEGTVFNVSLPLASN
jgi:two-component system nitrogen regulation sensor histidine kinase NtrY